MELSIRKTDNIYIIDVHEDLDLYNSYKLKELFMKMLEKKVEHIIINLENVEYIDSSGIGTLIFISSTAKKMNIKLSLASIRGTVKKAIQLTKLTSYLPIANTLNDAIESMTP